MEWWPLPLVFASLLAGYASVPGGRVVGQPSTPASGTAEVLLAKQSLKPAMAATPTIVRRYRRGPSPEVRDRVRGWRSGKWDRVLGGEFDVME